MESLESNTFFSALTTTFKKRYQEVISNCYHLCVPRNHSYDVKQLNDRFITSHILKPSPLLKSHFLPYNSKQNFHVQIDHGYIRVTKGFGDQNQTKIKILNEETAYNSANQTYSIFIIESPLISSLNCKLNYETQQSTSQDVQLVSFDDCQKFLRQVSPSELSALQCKITQLVKSYILLPDYIADLTKRLKQLIDASIEAFASAQQCHSGKSAAGAAQERHRTGGRPGAAAPAVNRELLCSVVESYSVGLIYEPLIGLIRKKLAAADRTFVQRARALKGEGGGSSNGGKQQHQQQQQRLAPSAFGAQAAFERFTIPPTLVTAFEEISAQVTPLAKVDAMRRTLDAVNDALKRTVDEHRSPLDAHPETVFIMSDDLIAAVICVLATCEPVAFCADIEFIHSFSWYLPQNSELGYSLVTFEVAKEYIQNHTHQNSSSGSSSTTARQQQPNRQLFGGGSSSSSSTRPLYNRQKSLPVAYSQFSHLDKEIDKISQMLESSDLQLKEPSPLSSKAKNEELGGFFGSFTGDFLTMSGHK